MSLVTVFRVEHLHCGGGKPHGPTTGYDACDSGRFPSFGYRGPTPQSDGHGHYIEKHEVCGVLREQLDAWWGGTDRRLCADEGWVISEYVVPEEDVVVLKWQVCFVRETAKRVNTHRNPAAFIEFRAPDLP